MMLAQNPEKETRILKGIMDPRAAERKEALRLLLLQRAEAVGDSPKIISALLLLLHSHSPIKRITACGAMGPFSHPRDNKPKIVGKNIGSRVVQRLLGFLIPDDQLIKATDLFELVAEQTEAAKALHRLTSTCPANLKFLASLSPVPRLLDMGLDRWRLESREARPLAMLMLRDLAVGDAKSREALIHECAAVSPLVDMIGESREMDRHSLALLHMMCLHSASSFRAQAKTTRAVAVLTLERQGWGEEERERARAILDVIRARN